MIIRAALVVGTAFTFPGEAERRKSGVGVRTVPGRSNTTAIQPQYSHVDGSVSDVVMSNVVVSNVVAGAALDQPWRQG